MLYMPSSSSKFLKVIAITKTLVFSSSSLLSIMLNVFIKRSSSIIQLMSFLFNDSSIHKMYCVK